MIPTSLFFWRPRYSPRDLGQTDMYFNYKNHQMPRTRMCSGDSGLHFWAVTQCFSGPIRPLNRYQGRRSEGLPVGEERGSPAPQAGPPPSGPRRPRIQREVKASPVSMVRFAFSHLFRENWVLTGSVLPSHQPWVLWRRLPGSQRCALLLPVPW